MLMMQHLILATIINTIEECSSQKECCSKERKK